MINPNAALMRKIKEQICERGFLCAPESLTIARFGRDEDDDREMVTVSFVVGGRPWLVTVTSPDSEPPLGLIEASSGNVKVCGPLQDETWARVLGAVSRKAA